MRSPSWAANRFAASQEIPRISRNPKVHYRTHKLPPPVSILAQPNPVHIPTSHLLEIHPNIIHSSTSRSPHWSLSLRFPHQDPIHSSLLTHTRHMPSPSHSSRFYHPHNIGWGLHRGTCDKLINELMLCMMCCTTYFVAGSSMGCLFMLMMFNLGYVKFSSNYQGLYGAHSFFLKINNSALMLSHLYWIFRLSQIDNLNARVETTLWRHFIRCI